jgi:hypothetical protein
MSCIMLETLLLREDTLLLREDKFHESVIVFEKMCKVWAQRKSDQGWDQMLPSCLIE